jgi:hypothetical protein
MGTLHSQQFKLADGDGVMDLPQESRRGGLIFQMEIMGIMGNICTVNALVCQVNMNEATKCDECKN